MQNNYNKILNVGYCDLQSLLKYVDPIAYSTRLEGWACDYYDINGILISTGYAPIENKNVKKDYDLMKSYEEQAQKINCNYDLSYEERKEKVTELLNNFIEEITIK